jgi:hypothetical protein
LLRLLSRQRNIYESGTILINTYQWPADGKTYEDYIGKQHEDQQLVCKVLDDMTNEKASSFLSGDIATLFPEIKVAFCKVL